MKLTKIVDFCAAHSIPGAGKCENLHGHNWEATIDVQMVHGELDERGFIADVRDIKQAAHQYDHNNLNDWFDVPSTENVAQKIADDVLKICVDNNSDGGFHINVTLVETKNNSAVANANNVLGSLNAGADFRKVGLQGSKHEAFNRGIKGSIIDDEPDPKS